MYKQTLTLEGKKHQASWGSLRRQMRIMEFISCLEPKVLGINITKIQSITLVKASASVCWYTGPAAAKHPQPLWALARQIWKVSRVQSILNPMDKNLRSPWMLIPNDVIFVFCCKPLCLNARQEFVCAEQAVLTVFGSATTRHHCFSHLPGFLFSRNCSSQLRQLVSNNRIS